MGKVESKNDIKIKNTINSQINSQIICPICNKLLEGNMTYNQLNNHLKECDFNLRDIQSIKYDNARIRQNLSEKNLSRKKLKNMIDQNYLSNNNNITNINNKTDNTINSEPQRGNQIKDNVNSSDISNVNTVNDFQLVIDYNNTKNHDLYEEKLKNEGKKVELYDKYSELRKFLIDKKNLMNFDIDIECKNYKELFNALKNCNIYYNTKFILSKIPKDGKIKERKILTLNLAVNKYIDIMIKNNIFYIKDNTLFFRFNSNQVDYEMVGILLSILFIYPEIKLRYFIPLILFKLLVNQRLDLNDIKNINNELYNKLFDLSKDKNINNKGLVYFYEGNELLIDGKNIKVNQKNVYDYIEKIVNYEIRKYKEEINIIKQNLFNLVPKKYILFFNEEELFRIINRTL